MQSVSVVVPVYSGEAYLERLVLAAAALREEWQSQRAPVRLEELILVDDAAIDGSADVIDRLAAQHSWVTGLHLSRNFGQHPATIAGILHSAGDWVVTLDEDLQHPPSSIPSLLCTAVADRSDLVYGRPQKAVHKNFFRDFSSRASKVIVEFLSGNPAIMKANSFRLVRGTIARGAASVCGHDTYLDIALSWYTQRITTLDLELKDERFIRTGRSGYSFKSLISHGRRLIFSSQLKPLRLAMLMGVLAVMASLASGVWVLLKKLLNPASIDIQGWASLFISVSFFGGVTIFLLGVMIEYLSVLVMRAHGKPLFFTIDRTRDGELKDFFTLPAREA